NLLRLPDFPQSGSPADGISGDIMATLRAQLDADVTSRVVPHLEQLLDARVKAIEARFAAYGTRIGANEKSLSLHGARVGNVEQKLQGLGVHLESAQQALGSAGTRIESSDQALSSQAARLAQLEARPKVCKGEVVVPGTSALASGSGDRDWSKHVIFPAGMFAQPPQIATSLYRVEFEAGRNARIQIESNNVTPVGFDLRCMTWLDTRIPTCAVQWIAIGS
ncbi:MAG TPA: H-type lectin domain-containing protein, partial [Myxococcales bacterium]|nr:H-type lectin domain-containing protein [Myxococcales bacterium]